MKSFLREEEEERTVCSVRPADSASNRRCLKCFLSPASICKGNSLSKVTPILTFNVSPTPDGSQTPGRLPRLPEIWPLPSFPDFFSTIPSVNPLILSQLPAPFVFLPKFWPSIAISYSGPYILWGGFSPAASMNTLTSSAQWLPTSRASVVCSAPLASVLFCFSFFLCLSSPTSRPQDWGNATFVSSQ